MFPKTTFSDLPLLDYHLVFEAFKSVLCLLSVQECHDIRVSWIDLRKREHFASLIATMVSEGLQSDKSDI